MKTKIIILLIAGFGILLNGCKKYDEGANISLRSKKGRVEGNWDVTVCKVDGQSAFNYSDTWNYYSFDCGQNFSVTETNKINNWTFDFNKEGGFDYTLNQTSKILDEPETDLYCYPIYTESSVTFSGNGKWKFSSDKEKITMTYNNQSSLFASGNSETYTIVELRNKEMKFKGSIDGSVIEFTFQQ